MVFAAGLGARMRPITEKTPKPLVSVAGRTLIDRALDDFENAGVEPAIVNVHHLADQIESHLAAAPDRASSFLTSARCCWIKAAGSRKRFR